MARNIFLVEINSLPSSFIRPGKFFFRAFFLSAVEAGEDQRHCKKSSERKPKKRRHIYTHFKLLDFKPKHTNTCTYLFYLYPKLKY